MANWHFLVLLEDLDANHLAGDVMYLRDTPNALVTNPKPALREGQAIIYLSDVPDTVSLQRFQEFLTEFARDSNRDLLGGKANFFDLSLIPKGTLKRLQRDRMEVLDWNLEAAGKIIKNRVSGVLLESADFEA